MTDDNAGGALDGRPAAPQTSPLTILAWIATGLYGLLVALLLIAGIAATTSHESAAMFAMAVVSGIPFAIMLAIMATVLGPPQRCRPLDLHPARRCLVPVPRPADHLMKPGR